MRVQKFLLKILVVWQRVMRAHLIGHAGVLRASCVARCCRSSGNDNELN